MKGRFCKRERFPDILNLLGAFDISQLVILICNVNQLRPLRFRFTASRYSARSSFCSWRSDSVSPSAFDFLYSSLILCIFCASMAFPLCLILHPIFTSGTPYPRSAVLFNAVYYTLFICPRPDGLSSTGFPNSSQTHPELDSRARPELHIRTLPE